MWFVRKRRTAAGHDLVLAEESRVSMGRPRPINSGQDQTFLWVAVDAIALCIPVLLVNFYLLRSLQCLAGFKLWCFIITIPPTSLLTLPNNLFFPDVCPEKNDFSEWGLISHRSDRYFPCFSELLSESGSLWQNRQKEVHRFFGQRDILIESLNRML